MEYTEEPREELIKDARRYIAANEQFLPDREPEGFETGRRVRHPIMGIGTVIAVDREKGAHVVKFDSMDTPRTISFRAKLEAAEVDTGTVLQYNP